MFFKTNEKGQVTVKGLALKHMEDLKDETGLVCCICREGYRYQPVKVGNAKLKNEIILYLAVMSLYIDMF